MTIFLDDDEDDDDDDDDDDIDNDDDSKSLMSVFWIYFSNYLFDGPLKWFHKTRK